MHIKWATLCRIAEREGDPSRIFANTSLRTNLNPTPLPAIWPTSLVRFGEKTARLYSARSVTEELKHEHHRPLAWQNARTLLLRC